MASFARKLEYAAHDGEGGGSFIALIVLTKRKGGTPISFFLYRYIVHYFDGKEELDMIRLKEPKTADEARCYFLFGKGSKFPGHDSPLWQKTTDWLYTVAVGGSYERHSPGVWARVGSPSPWKKRRKRKPLQIGNPAHIILVREAKIRLLVEEKSDLVHDLSDLKSYWSRASGNTASIEREIAVVDEKIAATYRDIQNLKDELRFKQARNLGKPFFPRDDQTGSVLIPS